MSMRVLISGITVAGMLVLPLQSYAQGHGPGPGPEPHGGSFVVPHGYYHPHPEPAPWSYHHGGLPAGVTFALLAGVTYAVIDGLYYRQDGDTYVYTDRPPAGTYTVVEAPATTTTVVQTTSGSSALADGTIVSALPGTAKSVIYAQRTYYVVGDNWFLPIDSNGTHSDFVVVPNPLK